MACVIFGKTIPWVAIYAHALQNCHTNVCKTLQKKKTMADTDSANYKHYTYFCGNLKQENGI